MIQTGVHTTKVRALDPPSLPRPQPVLFELHSSSKGGASVFDRKQADTGLEDGDSQARMTSEVRLLLPLEREVQI